MNIFSCHGGMVDRFVCWLRSPIKTGQSDKQAILIYLPKFYDSGITLRVRQHIDVDTFAEFVLYAINCSRMDSALHHNCVLNSTEPNICIV